MIGYKSPQYAKALSEHGTPRHLPGSGGWLLVRPIPESREKDAIGCYPLFSCRDWSRLGADLDDLPPELVAVSMVVDPFCDVDGATLAAWFPQVCRPFKEHYLVDFARDWRANVARHHRRNVRAAARRVEVERLAKPCNDLASWVELYNELVRRHGIRGLAKFSAASFAAQLQVPGIAAFRARCGGQTAGMLLWYCDRDVAYYHLGAFNSLGYRFGAAFALFDVALSDFAARGHRWAELGGGAGWQTAEDNGLTRFKRGWSNDRKTAWFCGRVIAQQAYRRLCTRHGFESSDFFPDFRRPDAILRRMPAAPSAAQSSEVRSPVGISDVAARGNH